MSTIPVTREWRAALSEQDVETLLLAFIETGGETGRSEAEIKALLEWANRTCADSLLLDMTLKGLLRPVSVDGDEVTFVEGKRHG